MGHKLARIAAELMGVRVAYLTVFVLSQPRLTLFCPTSMQWPTGCRADCHVQLHLQADQDGNSSCCLKVEGVRLYADQALYKKPHGGYTPWHCDAVYWPLATDKAITAWIPLQVCPSK